jgi:predicted DNA-binding protein (MmcQ/YjbR family)
MTIEELQKICRQFPGVTEDIKWSHHLCFNIGGKMFLVTGPDNVPVTASFKASDEDFASLPNRTGFIPAPYMAQHKWVFVDDINRLSGKEWEKYLKQAYTLVLAKLPQRFQNQIAGGKAVKPVAKKKKTVSKKKVNQKKAGTKKKTTRKKRK